MLSTHYRKPMDWTEKKREEAEKTLRKWRSLANSAKAGGVVDPEVLNALEDDLNTPSAITRLHKLAKTIEAQQRSDVSESVIDGFAASAQMLGLLEDTAGTGAWVFDGAVTHISLPIVLTELQEALSSIRTAAMASKDFSEVDRMKAALIDAGVEVRMSKDGVDLVPGPDFDPDKLEGLL